MSNWLVTLTYQRELKSGGNSTQYISAVTVKYQYSENCFAKFVGEYPTETEINRLIEAHTDEKELYDYGRYEIKKTVPTITFMQKLREEEE